MNRQQDKLNIDKAILSLYPQLSRRKIRRILDAGGIFLNERKVYVASERVATGDEVLMRYDPYDSDLVAPERLAFKPGDILFDQQGILAVNKPPHMVSVPTRSDRTQTVLAALKEFELTNGKNLKESSDRKADELFVCHRLDKETSGVLLCAKNQKSTEWVMEQFKKRQVKKCYYALVYGIPEQDRWTVECYLSDIDKAGLVRVVHAGGKSSRTQFEVLSVNLKQRISLLACYPETGRSHQIRVHLQVSKLPLLGDKKYGDVPLFLPESWLNLTLNHQFLHAYSVEFFPSPSAEKKILISAPQLPKNFAALLEQAHLNPK